LLHAIKQEVKRLHPEYKIIYITGEMFLNDMIAHLESGKMEDLRTKYRKSDIWLVDDVQFIAGKDRTEEEFLHTFNELFDSAKQIVLTADRLPQEITKLAARLESRFEQGLVADIKPPDFETRVAIVYNKAKQLNFEISAEIATMIAESLTANIRQLEGAVRIVHAMIEISGKESLSYSDIVKRIKENLRENEKKVNAELILDETASFFGIKPEDLRGKSRVKEIAHTRQVAMYLIREMTNLPFENIGEILGGRDHATVMSGIRNIQQEYSIKSDLRDQIRDIRHTITTKSSSA